MDMHGKTALVTGATDGVGRYVALKLATAGARVIVHGRDEARANSLAEEISRIGQGSVAIHIADLSSLAEVRRFADVVAASEPGLDLLLNNAGVGSQNGGPQRQTSVDGHELRFAVNYLSHFLLSYRLLPLLKSRSRSRIVNVASLGQSPIDFDDVMLEKRYDGSRAYGQSKLSQIMFTVDLAKELEPSVITVNALHPATYMNTTMVRAAGTTPMSTVEQGGDAILRLATAADVSETTGRFFNGLSKATPHSQAADDGARAQLRALSLELVGLTPNSP
ncbi:NAD(P)-dependent dehydrogenase (short-subunit alcohol dehydrogenase family) [Tardiphaga robiniae]|uniref:SDR family NAD(P)-dependent oxidoreductase n=1 Tax=Tardiphaga robiniae TaxID=943830 RepID=UPI00285EFBB6|nr:SDR family NAD(P)-dependent oxidoreductase [Tardiphaga robiniae]MDR6660849.1 NAD(P)-dependent dehydrogenase (short-subunit alcohol dehydrogenase family) [Tardiphaga robiniae]